jgi:hypothetical protein
VAVVRGNSVLFDWQALDENDDAAVLTSAELVVKYPNGNSFVEEAITLTLAAENHWMGKWYSGVSDPGWVHWSAKGSNATRDFAGDGKLRVTAGRANEKDDG